MPPALKAVRGTRDLLPPETALWSNVEATELFARGVGEETIIAASAVIPEQTVIPQTRW